MASVILRAPILYQSVQSAESSKGFLYNNFSETRGLTKSFTWSDSRAGERIITSPSRYSLFSSEFDRPASSIWSGIVAPSIEMGENIKTYPRSLVRPFDGVIISDEILSIENVEWRVGDNNWTRLTSDDYASELLNVSLDFKKIGMIPCQIRLILETEEIIYSKEKYVIVLAENSTELSAYLTSPTDAIQNGPSYSLGGVISSTQISASTIIDSVNDVSSGDTRIGVENTLAFPNSGYIAIDEEIISYNHVSRVWPYCLQGCTRGLFNSSPEPHLNGSNIRLIETEGLFDNVKQSELDGENKIDYKCICVKNTKEIETGNIGIYSPWSPSPQETGEKIQIAIERGQSGSTNFSQEIVDRFAEPFVGDSSGAKLLNISPITESWTGSLEKSFDSSGFGYVSRSNIDSSAGHIYLSEDSISGTAIYRFSSGTLSTIDKIRYNSSSIDESSVSVSYRYSDSESAIDTKIWTDFPIENHEVLTEVIRTIRVYANIFDIKIDFDRKDATGTSPSFGDMNITYWTGGFSKFLKSQGEKVTRELSIQGNHFTEQYAEFRAVFPEETMSNLPPLSSNDNYVIQSTYANGVGSASYAIKFNQSLATSFISYQDCFLSELTIYEKRIDWDNISESSIDLTLNAILYDGDPESGANAIGEASIDLELVAKVTRSSYRAFQFINEIKLEKDKKYWFMLYASSSPSVKGEWRFRGTNDLLYGNPDSNETKIFDYNNGFVKKKNINDFAIGFVAIGRLENILSGHIDRDSTIFYKLNPSGINDQDWDFNGISLSCNGPYNHPYKIGPFIHVSWRRSGDDGWHRFRPRKVSQIYGDFDLSPSSSYKTIPKDQYVLIRVSIDRFLSSDSREDVRGFGELGLGAQPAISKIYASFDQYVDFTIINNMVTGWIDVPSESGSAIAMSDLYSGWGDSLSPSEQFFIWVKRDYRGVTRPTPYSGFLLVFKHGVESKFEVSEYDSTNWESIQEEEIPESPSSITVPSSSNTGTYEVSWGAVSNASLYELQEENGSFSTIELTSESSYIVAGRADGAYRYRVRAANSAGSSEWIISAVIIVEKAVVEESSSSSSQSSSSNSSTSTDDSESSSSI